MRPLSNPGTGRRAAVAVAATVGAATVMTTGAASAQAYGPYSVWDRVANCESTNNWGISTGNGFYGGLQFSSSTWAAYGGHRYAYQANRASRIEQIQVARRVLASQGPGAWPVCSVRAGLTRYSGHATTYRLPVHAGIAALIARRAFFAQRHVGAVHAVAKKPAPRHAVASHGVYRVVPGDTLARIAAKRHVAGGWPALYRANRATVHNPGIIRVGQILRLP